MNGCSSHLLRLARISILWLLAALLAATAAGCSPAALPTFESDDQPPVGPAIGNTAPGFSLSTLNNNTISLEDFRGGYVLLNFFATWCGPCREEMPAIEAAYERYRSQGFTVLAVTSADPASDVEQYVDELGLTFPMLLDPEEQASRAYQITAYPTSFFIGPDGIIQDVVIGQMENDEIVEKISRLVTGSSEAASTSADQSTQPPADTQAPTAAMLSACVTANILNVRAGPGTGYEVVRGLVNGECVDVDARSANGEWLRLAEGQAPSGARLWASSQFLSVNGSIDQLPVQD